MAPERAPTSPAGTVSQPIGKPFNGQAKGLLWLTWRSYAGPPQYYIPPEGEALNLPVRRSRSQAEPLAPRAVRPGGAINPRGEAASTLGITASRRIPHKSPSSTNVAHSKKALTITVSAFFLISSFLSSRAASSQVLSAFVSLTTVFGMGTGVSSQLSPLNL